MFFEGSVLILKHTVGIFILNMTEVAKIEL